MTVKISGQRPRKLTTGAAVLPPRPPRHSRAGGNPNPVCRGTQHPPRHLQPSFLRRRGVGGGHHQPAHAPWVSLPGGGDGLAQPVRPGRRLSNTLEASFCAEALEEALGQGQREVFNTDQGSQFTSLEFTQVLQEHGVKISMDGKGRYQHNIFVERLWRTVKYEEVYLKAYASVLEAQRGLKDYFRFYNGLRPHQALGYRTPAEVLHGDQVVVVEESSRRRGSPGQETQALVEEPRSSLNSPLVLSK